jgi:hypothetical protein
MQDRLRRQDSWIIHYLAAEGDPAYPVISYYSLPAKSDYIAENVPSKCLTLCESTLGLG